MVHTVPSMFRHLTREFAGQEPPGQEPSAPRLALRHVLLAGEPLYAGDVRAWRRAMGTHADGPGAELIHLYGATENTLIKMFHRVGEVPEDRSKPIPIGRAISNAAAFLCVNGRLAGIGETGEIYIKTPFLSHGYFRDPEATAKIFVPNPLDPGSSDPVHRTGDLGRYLPDGTIEWVGRVDDLLKINGVRVEPEEVKQVVLSHPAVVDAAVVGTPGPSSKLVCYFVSPDETIEPEDLQSWCRRTLPVHTIPSIFVPMERLPLNVHGKLDRKALPTPRQLLEVTALKRPCNATQGTIHDIWCRVLGLSQIDIGSSFFVIGGHSLAAARIGPRLFQEFGVEVTPADLFEFPTITEQAALIQARQAPLGSTSLLKSSTLPSTPSPWLPPLEPAPGQETYALSHAQRRLWVLRQIDEDGAAYNIPGTYLLEGPLQAPDLRSALQVLVDRHEILRTTVIEVSGEPRQLISPRLELPWQTEDLRHKPKAEALARDLARLEASTPFDLTTDPPIRAKLLRLPPSSTGKPQHVLLLTLHHIACDGWSLGLLLSELLQIYTAICDHGPTYQPPAPDTLQYKDFAAWQRQRLAENAFAESRAYWHERLAGELPRLNLPTDRPRGRTQTFVGRSIRHSFSPELTERLQAFCAAHQASLFMGLLTLFQILLYRYTHQRDLVVGTAVAGRHLPELEPQIGCYLNLLALRGEIDPAAGFAEHLRQTVAQTGSDLTHQHYPFDLLVDELGTVRDLSRSPIFDTLLMLHNQPSIGPIRGDLDISDFMPRDGVSRYDLTLHCRLENDRIENERIVNGRLDMEFEYNTDLFAARRIEGILRHFTRLTEQALTEPRNAIGSLSLLGEAEELEMLAFSEPSLKTETPPKDISALFENTVARRAGDLAITCGDRRLSYRDLHRAAHAVAHHLRSQQGIAGGDAVGIMLERSEALPIAMLGVLASGAAYVPVDPDFPRDRVLHMLRNSDCRLLITEPELADTFAARPEDLSNQVRALTRGQIPGLQTPRATTDSPRSGPDSLLFRVMDPPPPSPRSKDPAYLIYTSGSSGMPKGVVANRGNLAAYAVAFQRWLKPRADDVILGLTTVSFDISLTELVVGPALGMSLVMANSEEVLDPRRLAQKILEQKVTVLQTTPSRLQTLLDEAGEDFLHGLRCLVLGGEIFPPSLARRLLRIGGFEIHNIYGPTETTVWSAAYRIQDENVALGRPLAGERIFVLSPEGELMPPGYAGEIYIGGAGVTDGYHRRPELTAERFVPHRLARSGLLYRTGDLGMWSFDGELIYLGRLDSQIKFRGYRIEPGEIEGLLVRHPSVRQAAVSVVEVAGEPTLCAYIVGDIEPSSLRRHLADSLPTYMIPSRFISLPELPTTPNNKIDRKGLPSPESACAENETVSTGPRNETEVQVARLWCDVLGLEQVDVHQRFFESGGDSLRAIRLFRRLDELCPGAFKASDLFSATTVAQQADLMSRLGRSRSGQGAEAILPSATQMVEVEI